jgi:hypothetical protein
MNQDEIIKQLKQPFAISEIEWKVQVTTQDKTKGMVVAYIDSRAIQNRLDEVVGAFNWRNIFSPWQNNSQICGLSIYDSERGEWLVKQDGAENTDIEPVKGGLSDSFKRAASVWGIGRYLYELTGIWAEIEQRGKNSIIKENQYAKLETEYNKAVAKIFGAAANQEKTPVPAIPVNNETQSKPSTENKKQPTANTTGSDYWVQAVKPGGKDSLRLELVNTDGKIISAYIKNSDKSIKVGSMLQDVDIVQKQSSYGQYNLINGYKVAA